MTITHHTASRWHNGKRPPHGWKFRVERAYAAREVTLSAGAIGSPHILQLSGVGGPEHLGRIGVPVVHELRGVGKNMQDHYVARVSYPVVEESTATVYVSLQITACRIGKQSS